MNAEIIKQGDIVRKLKEQKAAKEEIDKAVKSLLSIKADYKKVTNTDWKPGCTPPSASPSNGPVQNTNDLNTKIAAQGEKVCTKFNLHFTFLTSNCKQIVGQLYSQCLEFYAQSLVSFANINASFPNALSDLVR